CGEVFTTNTGEITSPGYPGIYPSFVYGCEYVIIVPESRAILLAFDFIDLGWPYDYIHVSIM
ncbi:hypothetical protein QYM36_003537, partial [Artemia franciscana]